MQLMTTSTSPSCRICHWHKQGSGIQVMDISSLHFQWLKFALVSLI